MDRSARRSRSSSPASKAALAWESAARMLVGECSIHAARFDGIFKVIVRAR
jgi:hypothetical protein